MKGKRNIERDGINSRNKLAALNSLFHCSSQNDEKIFIFQYI